MADGMRKKYGKAELENKPWSGGEWFLRYLADTVSFYNYEGNVLRIYLMINKELLEQGYYLQRLTYSEGKLTGCMEINENEENVSQLETEETTNIVKTESIIEMEINEEQIDLTPERFFFQPDENVICVYEGTIEFDSKIEIGHTYLYS